MAVAPKASTKAKAKAKRVSKGKKKATPAKSEEKAEETTSSRKSRTTLPPDEVFLRAGSKACQKCRTAGIECWTGPGKACERCRPKKEGCHGELTPEAIRLMHGDPTVPKVPNDRK